MATELPPADPNVRIPAAVAAAAANVDAIHAKAYGTPEAKPTGDAPTGGSDSFIQIQDTTPKPLPRVSTPAGDKVVIPKGAQSAPLVAAQGGPVTENPNEVKPTLKLTPKGAPPADTQPPADPDMSEDARYWRQRALSEEGRIQAANRTLQQTQELLAAQSAENARLAALAVQRVQPQPDQQPAVPSLSGDYTSEEVAQYGREALEVMERAAQRRLAPVLDKLGRATQELDKRTKQLDTTVQQSQVRATNQANWAALDQALPNWRQINTSQEFAEWLSLPDFYSGVVRSELLKNAFASGDTGRVVRFFQGFVAEASAAPAIPGKQAGSQPAPQGPAFALAALAAPGPAKQAPGTQSPGPAEKRIYSHNDIKSFYRAIQQGFYAGRDEERQAWEQDIFAAQREGRVR